jgi:glycine/D-amino acid oxidase-like deaminating enzyme
VGGLRQQFSTPENIRISHFGAGFVRGAHETLAVKGSAPELGFVEAGYLFLATERGVDVLRRNHELQISLGADVALMTPDQLVARFPWLSPVDLAAGSLGLSGEGWLDPYSLLMAFRAKAQSLGVAYESDEVVGIQRDGPRVTGVRTASGTTISAGVVVNAAGPAAARVAAMAGIPDLPVRSRKRTVYRISCREEVPGSPLVIDPGGVYFRPEGAEFLCGVSPPAERDPDSDDLEVEYDLFQEIVWPALARRVPAFEAIKLGPSWAGHYAYNIRDQNAILGPHPEVENFHFANGFSGHGLQQSPAVGRAIAELITHGEYRTLELSRFGFRRFADGALVREENVV